MGLLSWRYCRQRRLEPHTSDVCYFGEDFTDCEEGDEKIYCPKVGLAVDEDLELVRYGFFDGDGDDDGDDDYRKWWKYKNTAGGTRIE